MAGFFDYESVSFVLLCIDIMLWSIILFSCCVHSHVAEHANCHVRNFLEAAKLDITPQGDWVGSVRRDLRKCTSHVKTADLKKYHDIFKFLGHVRLLSHLSAECHTWVSPITRALSSLYTVLLQGAVSLTFLRALNHNLAP